MEKVSEDKFKFFEPLTQKGILQGVTAEHWILLLGLVDSHAETTKGIDPVAMHARLNDEYNNLITAWFLSSSFGSRLRSIHEVISEESFASMERTHVYTLDDLLLLLNMWRSVMVKNEVFEMVSSIDLGREYILHLKEIKGERTNVRKVLDIVQEIVEKAENAEKAEKVQEVQEVQEVQSKEVIQDEDRIKIFEPLRHVVNGAIHSDWTKLFMLIEKDAMKRTGNENAFRHDEIGHQVYPQILVHWYEQSSVRQKFDAEELIHGTLSITTMDRILRSHRFSLEDLDILLDIMQNAMEQNDMKYNIPSIDLARDFIMGLRLQRDLEEINSRGKVSHEWDKLG